MALSEKKVAFYGFARSEHLVRTLGGIVEYRKQQGTIDLFHYLIDVHRSFQNEAPPPWRGKVDGVLIGTAIVGEADDVVDWLASGDAPAVTMLSNVLDSRLPAVIVDPASVVRLAIRELYRCRCRRLVYIGYAPSAGSQLRGDAFERAAGRLGIPQTRIDCQILNVEEEGEDLSENHRIAELLSGGPFPVGVHALNDAAGRRVLRICEAMGLRVPDDVAIVSADDTPTAFDCRPTLTSVCYPGERIGYRAAELLCELVDGGAPPRKPVLVPATEINVRESSGGKPDTDELVRALEIIRRKATLGLKVQELADALPINRRKLERAFRNRLGRSPAFEIQRQRMSVARQLLRDTRFTISRIAALVGYVEPAAFSNAFRRETGFWPREYRREPHLGLSNPQVP